MLVSSPVWSRTPVVIGLLAVRLGGPATTAASEIAGTSGTIAWRLTDLTLGKTSIGGKDHATYGFKPGAPERRPESPDARPLRDASRLVPETLDSRARELRLELGE
jgi:hypothetical protein